MPEIVRCPQCERQLRVPEDLLGKKVKCPTCGETFTAGAEAPEKPAPPAREEEPRPRSRTSVQRDEDYEREKRPSRASRPLSLPGERDDEDDEETDDDEDRPRRRRRRGRRKAAAAEMVNAPGILLMVSGGIHILVGILMVLNHLLGFTTLGRGAMNADPAFAAGQTAGTIMGLVWDVVILIMAVLTIMGGWKMRNLESHGLAMTAAITSVIPCTACCLLIGLPAGIWSLIVLNNPDVKSAFDS